MIKVGPALRDYKENERTIRRSKNSVDHAALGIADSKASLHLAKSQSAFSILTARLVWISAILPPQAIWFDDLV
jgi:hypothetical protein